MTDRDTPAPTDAEFLRGATAVLAQMEAGSTLYNEVVRFIGETALIRQARRDGMMRWSGLSAYVRDKKKWGQP